MKIKNSIDTTFIDPEKVIIPQPQRIAASKAGMVSSAHYRATEAGAQILAEGGKGKNRNLTGCLSYIYNKISNIAVLCRNNQCCTDVRIDLTGFVFTASFIPTRSFSR